MEKIYVIICVVIFLIINYVLQYLDIKKRTVKITQYISSSNSPKFFSEYKSSIENKLFNLDFPYKLTFKKYFFIKYVLSILVFIVSFINYKSIIVPLIISLIVFIFPNLIIKNYINSQNIKLIKELKTINTNLILQLSSYVSLKNAIKAMINFIQDERIKKHFSKFVYDYEVTNFNIKKAADNLLCKFKSHELEMFLQLLIQSEDEGNIIENLERFNTTLELSYFKYLKGQANKRLGYVVVGTVIMLINIIIISMYPILIQVANNLEKIFS